MRSFAEALSRWQTTFAQNSNLSDLRAAARSTGSDNPCDNGLRSVCWKSFLVFENLDRSTWPKTIRDSRSAYASLKKHFLKGVEHTEDVSAIDPLTEDENSPWNTLRQDEILRGEILQDVERCMPDNHFFREPSSQAMLLDILFIFCKLNSDVGYRQGMHELLAPILWVVFCDAISSASTSQPVEDQGEDYELLRATLDSEHIEHDAFTLFCIIMQPAKSFYETASIAKSLAPSAPSSSPIVERSKRIHEVFLRRTDPELAEHLTEIDILPQIFVIRWIRLLFGREFPFNDVLRLWDVMFAEDPALEMIDLVCVAMLIRIRWQLLEADYSQALTLLLRYPVPEPPSGPVTFVEDALYLRQKLSIEGGKFLISKYTGRVPAVLQSSSGSFRKGRSLHTPRGSADHGARSPLRSPTRFLGDSGGIEGLLQEAAKNVYRRSEQWGVGQALRGAVQGLQAASDTPRRSISNIRWSLDDGRPVPLSHEIHARMKTFEDRNKTLAKMLQNAMEELSEQSKILEQQEAATAANALALTVAKLQFVHVYLDDPSLPLGTENAKPHSKEDENMESKKSQRDDDKSSDTTGPTKATNPPVPAPRSINSSADLETTSQDSPSTSKVGSPTPRARRRQAPSRVAATKVEDGTYDGSSFQRPRPSLAQSSFSWMLGDDGSKPAFGAALPFSPEKERKSATRGKAGFLFGDDNEDAQQAMPGGPKKAKEEDDREDSDGFTMGTLKSVRKR